MSLFAAAQSLVSNVSGLVTALKACTAACVVTLSPGDWRNVRIDHVDSHATIVGPGAVIHDLTITNSSGLTFSGLELSTAGAPAGPFGPGSDSLYKVGSSRMITFDGLKVHGDSRGTLADTASGFLIRSSSYITVSNSEFSYLHHAVAHLDVEHLTIRNNTFHNLFDDSMRGGGSSWVTIDRNSCYSNHPDLSDRDHPDCIQFWTYNTKSSAHDLTITNNKMDRGSGNSTQFIFLGNEIGMPYENVVITNNMAYGAAWNGIAITVARNVKITGNTLYPSCHPENGKMLNTWVMTGRVEDLTLADNVAADFLERAPNIRKTQYNNRKSGCLDHSPG